MKVTITTTREVEVFALHARFSPRYWEDATVDGVEDTDGTLIPCRDGDSVEFHIDVSKGHITNWQQGKTAKLHYKVCDDGEYCLRDVHGNPIAERPYGSYVPDILEVTRESYGDYIILEINESGYIKNWNPNASIEDFEPINQ